MENAIEHAVVLSRSSRIDLEDLPEQIALAPLSILSPDEARPLEAVEQDYIMAVVRAAGGNKAKAAKQLGIGPLTLYRKLKMYERGGGTS